MTQTLPITRPFWTAVASEARHRFGDTFESAVAAALCRGTTNPPAVFASLVKPSSLP